MKKAVELPLLEPMYSTYHYQALAIAISNENRSIRNWYLDHALMLTCGRSFTAGISTPQIGVHHTHWYWIPHIEWIRYPLEFSDGYINYIIRNLLDAGYYVVYNGVDDYYIKGKSWYRQRHFDHDGLICGYDQNDRTYSIYAYDSQWIYRRFRTPQVCFNRGRILSAQNGGHGDIYAIRVKPEPISFSPEAALAQMTEYLDSDFLKYPDTEYTNANGIVVLDYMVRYLERLYSGAIEYRFMDWRVFRQIWEHKKVMHESISQIERTLQIPPDCSKRYRALIEQADSMRVLYAMHHKKRRDSLLPVIAEKLKIMRAEEEDILTDFLKVSA